MPLPQGSPRISALSWGRVEVDSLGVFKDVKTYPGGAREWDWNETGTRHSPGIQPADVQELLSRGASVVVLGVGMLGRLKVQRETLEMLRGSSGPRPEDEPGRRVVQRVKGAGAGGRLVPHDLLRQGVTDHGGVGGPSGPILRLLSKPGLAGRTGLGIPAPPAPPCSPGSRPTPTTFATLPSGTSNPWAPWTPYPPEIQGIGPVVVLVSWFQELNEPMGEGS